jgi:hypothetical protein
MLFRSVAAALALAIGAALPALAQTGPGKTLIADYTLVLKGCDAKRECRTMMQNAVTHAYFGSGGEIVDYTSGDRTTKLRLGQTSTTRTKKETFSIAWTQEPGRYLARYRLNDIAMDFTFRVSGSHCTVNAAVRLPKLVVTSQVLLNSCDVVGGHRKR